MPMPVENFWIGPVCVANGVVLLRLAWKKTQRSMAMNAIAWALILAGALAGVFAEGAWGLAVTALTLMLAAFAALTHSAAIAPAGKNRASTRRAHVLPDQGEPLQVPRRLATFVLSLPGAGLSALVLALGMRAGASSVGVSEANANVLALLAMPLTWATLLVCVLLVPQRRVQIACLGLPAILGCVLIWTGSAG